MRLRVGRKLGVTLYCQIGPEPSDDDEFIGTMQSKEWAERIVALFDEHNEVRRKANIERARALMTGHNESSKELFNEAAQRRTEREQEVRRLRNGIVDAQNWIHRIYCPGRLDHSVACKQLNDLLASTRSER